ncbi:MAG: hypothetical protein IPM29_17215 [Planctomycetes bacterium]|nr:hypothetical protein [Planctomycetota bacterium]
MRFVFDRVCGRVADAPVEAEPVDIAMPRLQTAADCNNAIAMVIDSLCSGAVDRDVAKLLLDAVQARMRAIEMDDMEQRLAEVERTAQALEPPRHGRPRRA